MSVASGVMIGLGDGAGVGGETMGMYIVEALSPASIIAGGSLTDIVEIEAARSSGCEILRRVSMDILDVDGVDLSN